MFLGIRSPGAAQVFIRRIRPPPATQDTTIAKMLHNEAHLRILKPQLTDTMLLNLRKLPSSIVPYSVKFLPIHPTPGRLFTCQPGIIARHGLADGWGKFSVHGSFFVIKTTQTAVPSKKQGRKTQVRKFVLDKVASIAQPGLDFLVRLIQVLGKVQQLLHLDQAQE